MVGKAGDDEIARFGSLTKEHVLLSLGLRSELGAGQQAPHEITLNRDTILANAIPGRRFDPASTRKGYLYVDTWHIIGPWDVDGRIGPYQRIDFSRIYPPEQDVNLDALYGSGKTHRVYDDERGYFGRDQLSGRLKWKFYQSPTVEVRIPREQLANDALYFAYTEVYCENDTVMNLAFASDDAARIRINGEIVFEDHLLSPYELSEEIRQVQFKKGYNKILVRLVNGPGPARFSMLLLPNES
ncbi:hypothetical protein [Sulfuriroseicoccus oceanibius]|uniref:Uncharacterized protein n=1 Tax=Sulfuriroseicoccus oceanibius TaxID=2707525 RepID=A0A6B3LCI8_9BACT|nr:hypothetical protein [Sulfuriroseicoccus oceanibius]QQL44748.1 hypothetical protein G3M56_012840 [Sulfuriroseicoccus oceanibius]